MLETKEDTTQAIQLMLEMDGATIAALELVPCSELLQLVSMMQPKWPSQEIDGDKKISMEEDR